jgi:uncharacterized membrane protein YkvA (DUF1232 family)
MPERNRSRAKGRIAHDISPAAGRSSVRQDQSREDQIKTMTQTDENNTGNILQEIWQNGQLAWRLYSDPRVSFLLKAMVPALWLAYFILPIDLVPDLIPVLGQLDDIAVLLLLVRLFISLAPPEIVAEHRGEAPAGNAGRRPRRCDRRRLPCGERCLTTARPTWPCCAPRRWRSN